MTVIGLTGSFGTGKSFAASLFKSLGAKVVDADRIAHAVQRKGLPVYKRMVGAFGKKILDKKGNVDRRRLADIVFDDKAQLNKLNRIVHPEVIRIIKDEIEAASEDVIVIDAPLLIEANLTAIVDKLIVVKSSRSNQISRCVKKFNTRREDVLNRIENQISLEKKMRMADFVIDNDGARSDTRKQVKMVWEKISRNISCGVIKR